MTQCRKLMVAQGGAKLVASPKMGCLTWNAQSVWEPAPFGGNKGCSREGNSMYQTQITSGFSDRCGQILEGTMGSSQRGAQRGPWARSWRPQELVDLVPWKVRTHNLSACLGLGF